MRELTRPPAAFSQYPFVSQSGWGNSSERTMSWDDEELIDFADEEEAQGGNAAQQLREVERECAQVRSPETEHTATSRRPPAAALPAPPPLYSSSPLPLPPACAQVEAEIERLLARQAALQAERERLQRILVAGGCKGATGGCCAAGCL